MPSVTAEKVNNSGSPRGARIVRGRTRPQRELHGIEWAGVGGMFHDTVAASGERHGEGEDGNGQEMAVHVDS
jgi:hypothetical protein